MLGLIIVLCLLGREVVVAQTEIELPVGCNITRIAACLTQHVDLDSDGKINATEVDEYIYAAPCGPPFSSDYPGVDVVSFFDLTGDGYIDINDLEYDQFETTGRKSLFVGTDFLQVLRAACMECDSCDFYHQFPTE